MESSEHDFDEAPAIKALGSLFNLTQVFLWDDSSAATKETIPGSPHEEETTDDTELSTQLGALGLPTSFRTSKVCSQLESHYAEVSKQNKRSLKNSDYGGQAVKWGLTHPKESAYHCCQACFDHARRAKPGENKCNIWVYCPSETGCYSPDIYQHKHMECWLKYAEQPKLNFKDKYPESYRSSHSNVTEVVPWVSGVITA